VLARAGKEWSPRINQALPFPNKAAAEKVAAGFAVNSTAKEYLAVRV
jgi:hypothetical protein